MEYSRQAPSLAEERQDEGAVHLAWLHLFKVIIPEMKPIKYTEDCFKSTEENVMFEDVDKKDYCRQSVDESTKAKSMSWMPRETTKAMSAIKAEATRAMPRVAPTQSKRRIWDPGRSEAHVVLRGVNVGNKHDHPV